MLTCFRLPIYSHAFLQKKQLWFRLKTSINVNSWFESNKQQYQPSRCIDALYGMIWIHVDHSGRPRALCEYDAFIYKSSLPRIIQISQSLLINLHKSNAISNCPTIGHVQVSVKKDILDEKFIIAIHIITYDLFHNNTNVKRSIENKTGFPCHVSTNCRYKWISATCFTWLKSKPMAQPSGVEVIVDEWS